MKKLIALLLALTVLFSLAACAAKTPAASNDTPASADTPASDTPAQDTPAKTWDISVSSPTNTDTIGIQANLMSEEMSSETNGVVTAHFFGNNVLGSQRDVFNAMTTGEIEMVVDGGVPVDLFAPEYGFLVAPFLLRSMDHLKAIVDSDIWQGFEQKLEDNGIMILGVIYRGPRQTVSTKPIDWSNPSSVIIRLPDVATYVAAWSALGANTQIMGAGDVYTSLQNGVINATEGPYAQHASMGMSDICTYLYETNHLQEFYYVYASKVWFDQLPAETQEQVRSAVTVMCDETSKLALDEAEACRDQLIEGGMTYEIPDTTALFDAVAPTWNEKFESGEWTSSMDEIMSYNK